MKKLILLLCVLSVFCGKTFASQTNETATIAITNAPTGTNGESITFQGFNYVWTNTSPIIGQLQVSTNGISGDTTNLFKQLSNDWSSGGLIFSLTATNAIQIRTYPNIYIAISNSAGWMTSGIVTNIVAAGNATSLTASNLNATASITLNGDTRTVWPTAGGTNYMTNGQPVTLGQLPSIPASLTTNLAVTVTGIMATGAVASAAVVTGAQSNLITTALQPSATNGLETVAHAAATYYPTSNPSGFISSVPGYYVTNNQTGVTLTGTFSGNGGGLTNVSVSNITGSTVSNLTVMNLKLVNPLAFTNLSSVGGTAGQLFAADGSGNVVLSSILTNSTVSGHWQMIGKTNDESLLFTNTSIDRTWGPGLNITPDPINLLMNLEFGGSSAVGGSVAMIQSQATNYSVAMMYSTAGGGNSVAMSGGMAMGYGSVAFGGASSSCSALGDNDVCINGFIANGHGNGAVAMGSGAIATNADAFAIFGTAGGASSFAFNGGVALGDRSLAFGYSYATAAGSILFSDLSAATTNNVPSSFMIANTNGIYFKSPFIVRPGSGTTITNGNSKAQWYLTLKLVSAVTGAPAFTVARPNVYTNTLAPLGLVASTTTNTWVWNLNANTVGTVTDVSGTGASVTVVDSHIEQ